MPTLVLLESPAKCKKIGDILKSLGHDVVVKASYGHVTDLDKKKLSVDVSNNFKPQYIISHDKKQVVSDLKTYYKKYNKILLGCDFDREGEAIAWHVSEQLKVPKTERKRMLFTEITKGALEKAFNNPVDLDMNMFYAQQARRIIDRLIGYKITPILWANIQNSMKKDVSLSAGRVQSVVNKLVCEREAEINKFSTSSYYKTTGKFSNLKNKTKINAELHQRIVDKDKAYDLLEICANAEFKVGKINKSISKRNPTAPFTTSTIQQEVSSKFRIGPKKLMMLLQKLYEGGLITYMRTDSTLISEDMLDQIEKMVIEEHGEKYSNKKQYKSKSTGAQEAHEAIRPTDLGLRKLEDYDGGDFTMDHFKVYNLIWRRTVASQMSQAKIENITLIINIYDESVMVKDYYFTSKNQKMLFDGFTIIYKPFVEDDGDDATTDGDNTGQTLGIKDVKEGTDLNMKSAYSIEKYTKPPHLRFTEASLIKKLDELGIGRPSTYSSMVTTVQDRKYVALKDKEGETKKYSVLKLLGDTIEENEDKIIINGEKNKLLPTTIGEIVNKFLCANFENILNYNFTANLEKNLDLISKGQKDWVTVVRDVYKSFNEIVVKLGSSGSSSLDKDKYRRVLGIDPATNFEICTYIGKFGPLVQLKNTTDAKKCKFAPLKELKMEEITLEQAIAMLKYPYDWGKFNKKNVQVCKGKFGVYLKYDEKNISMNGTTEENLNAEVIKNLVSGGCGSNAGNSGDNKSGSSSAGIIKTINKDIVIRTGQYGPYINYKNKHNIKIYSKKPLDELDVDDCMTMIQKKFKKK
jgi:DNA topoisomerase I